MKKALLIVVLCTLYGMPEVLAQKLPNVQEKSLFAPAGVKVDGKTTEWKNEFAAYNKATEVYYTLSNNNDNLYLILHATNPFIINKLIGGGATLTINAAGKRSEKNSIAITFPAYEGNTFRYIKQVAPQKISDSSRYKMQVDSFIHAINKQLGSLAITFMANGIKDVPEELISVYNEYGIKSTALFDEHGSYTSELSVPLKYLNLSKAGKFAYNIRLNGASANGAQVQLSSSGRFILITLNGKPLYGMIANAEGMVKAFPTDFWGDYTLATQSELK